MESTKTVSAGLIYTDGIKFLGCHSTGNKFFDLPKGSIEEGELAIDACIREAEEEANLLIDKNDLVDLGLYAYNGHKNLHLFLLLTDTHKLPSLVDLECKSFFFHPRHQSNRPEADGYRYISFNDMDSFVTNNMANVLKEVHKNMSEYLKRFKKQPS